MQKARGTFSSCSAEKLVLTSLVRMMLFRHCLTLCMETGGFRALWCLWQWWRLRAVKQVDEFPLCSSLPGISTGATVNFLRKDQDFLPDSGAPGVTIKQILMLPVKVMILLPKNSYRELVCLLLTERFYYWTKAFGISSSLRSSKMNKIKQMIYICKDPRSPFLYFLWQ